MYTMVSVGISTLYSIIVVNKLYTTLSVMRTIIVDQLIPIVELFHGCMIIYSDVSIFQEINLIMIQSNLLIINYMNQYTAIPPRYFTLVSIDTTEHNMYAP